MNVRHGWSVLEVVSDVNPRVTSKCMCMLPDVMWKSAHGVLIVQAHAGACVQCEHTSMA